MTALAWLIPAALALGGIGLAAFLWALRSGQFEDLDGAAWRALEDESPRDRGGDAADFLRPKGSLVDDFRTNKLADSP
jgi:cbb3-type cytochrome oxidase maturation protein